MKKLLLFTFLFLGGQIYLGLLPMTRKTSLFTLLMKMKWDQVIPKLLNIQL